MAILIAGIILISIFIIYPKILRRKYLGKPMKLKEGQRFKFQQKLADYNGMIVFYANPIFGKIKRSKRIFEAPKNKNHSELIPGKHYRVVLDEDENLKIE